MRRLLIASVLAAATTAAVPAGASAASPRAKVCSSADLRYPFQPGGPKTFGVFRLTVSGASCATAHAAAEAFAKAMEASIAQGSGKPPKRAGGFAFTSLPATAAQTFNERGRRGGVTVRFGYVVPNG